MEKVENMQTIDEMQSCYSMVFYALTISSNCFSLSTAICSEVELLCHSAEHG